MRQNFLRKRRSPRNNCFYTCLALQQNQETWFMYSRCSSHMTRTKCNFINFDNTFKSKIKLTNDKQVNVERKSDIIVKTKRGNSKIIKDVFYVPSLSQNLLSVGQLMEKWYVLKFDDGVCLIIDKMKN